MMNLEFRARKTGSTESTWMCPFCDRENHISDEQCSACGAIIVVMRELEDELDVMQDIYDMKGEH